jgi:hypothetical protein
VDVNDGFTLDTDDTLSSETKEFRNGYHNAIMQFQKKYNLKSINTPTEPPKTNPTKETQTNTPSSSQPKEDNSARDAKEKGKSNEESLKKALEASKETCIKEVDKAPPPFNFENKMARINFFVPFNELIKKGEYRNQIIKMLKMEEAPDTLKIQDNHPTILFGLHVE